MHYANYHHGYAYPLARYAESPETRRRFRSQGRRDVIVVGAFPEATEAGPITACLYQDEFRIRNVRKTCEKSKSYAVWHGDRRFRLRDHNREFPVSQLAELESASESNIEPVVQ